MPDRAIKGSQGTVTFQKADQGYHRRNANAFAPGAGPRVPSSSTIIGALCLRSKGATKKIERLRRFYGITEPRGLAYFAVHEEGDVRHRAAWRGWLMQNVNGSAEGVLRTAEKALQALWKALDPVFTHRG